MSTHQHKVAEKKLKHRRNEFDRTPDTRGMTRPGSLNIKKQSTSYRTRMNKR